MTMIIIIGKRLNIYNHSTKIPNFQLLQSSKIFNLFSHNQESQIKRIFGSMINQKLQDFEEEVKPIGEIMTQATIEMYNSIVQRFLPTPTKIHYLFNLRDISRVRKACFVRLLGGFVDISTRAVA